MQDSILILFASQTGTAEELARDAESQLVDNGHVVRCLDCYDAQPDFLREQSTCLLFASTWGEGDPPDDAEEFYHRLEKNTLLDLTHLRFAVFGLGDSSYEEFNECGKNFDRMLAERGGSRLLLRVDCDIDIDGPFDAWIEQLLEVLNKETSAVC